MSQKQIENFQQLLKVSSRKRKNRVIVVFPNNAETFRAIIEAQKQLGIQVLVVGPQKTMKTGIRAAGGNARHVKVFDAPDASTALRKSIGLVRKGEGDILMKGSIDTSTFMKAMLAEKAGLRTSRLMSDIFVLEYPQRQGNKFVMITDGGMTLSPDLANKVELVNNAVEVAHALGNPNPKVAILSATEFVVPKLPSTIDAAALSKMNQRGQIKGCVVDGPFALDNALSPEAAEEKGIDSPVAGCAEILVAANIESANSLAKSTTYFANLPLAHVIVGGRVPILIPSRADKSDARLHSIALGIVVSRWRNENSRNGKTSKG